MKKMMMGEMTSGDKGLQDVRLREMVLAQLGNLCGDCFHQASLRGKLTQCVPCSHIDFEA